MNFISSIILMNLMQLLLLNSLKTPRFKYLPFNI